MTVPALLQRIRDLEAAVNHRDSQIREWRKCVMDRDNSAVYITILNF